jgi:mono/diheme cytochrome c family protein
VQPLFDLRCTQCHGPRGFAHRLDGYARFTAEFDAILAVATDGRMPLPPNPRLTPAQLQLLRDWRDAGFPE